MIEFIKKLYQGTQLQMIHALLKNGYLKEKGWHRSFKEHKPVDAQGKPIPWISYPAIDFIASRVKPEMTVFEFGSGYSSLWWASRVNRVDAYENDIMWFQLVKEMSPKNMMVYLHQDESYFDAAAQMKRTYDVIVVDGVERNKCVDNAITLSGSSGVIIWDDSEQITLFQNSFDRLYSAGFKRVFFVGIGPVLNNLKETSIFYRTDNKFGL